MAIQELGKTQDGTGQEAMGSVSSDDINITAPGKLRVIKRNGKVVPFEDDKIKVAVTKAFLANESGRLPGPKKPPTINNRSHGDARIRSRLRWKRGRGQQYYLPESQDLDSGLLLKPESMGHFLA